MSIGPLGTAYVLAILSGIPMISEGPRSVGVQPRAVRSYESLAVCFAPQDHGSGFVLGLAAVLI